MSTSSSKKLLLIGYTGFMGSKIADVAPEEYTVMGTTSRKNNADEGLLFLDITDQDAVYRLLDEVAPDLVIHTAAISSADVCEKKPDLAWNVNHYGVKNVANACRKHKIPMVYFSTSYVFDGKRGGYKETDPVSPINVYGETHAAAEEETIKVPQHIICRYSITYGYNGPDRNNGFFGKMLEGKPLRVNNTYLRQPPLADDMGNAIFRLLEIGEKGIFNFGPDEVMTKYEMARRIAEELELPIELIPGSPHDEFAKRPFDVSLDTTKARSLGITLRELEEGCREIKRQIEASK